MPVQFISMFSLCIVTLCYSLELWYYTAVLILVGLLKNAKLQVDVMSIW